MTENPFVNAGYNPDVRPDAEERADVPRDGYGRYLMPRPGMEHTASAPVASTRVSTVKSAGINRKGLEIWGKRTVVKGFLRDVKPEELAGCSGVELLLAALKVLDDKQELDRIIAEAYNRGGGKERSSLGTAVHEFTERRNRGEDLPVESAPAEHQRDIRAYEAALERFGVQVIAEYLERVVNCPWSIQGTADNIVWFLNPNVVPDDLKPGDTPPGEPEMRVADLKTGRDLSLGWGEIIIQLWLYANATHMWNAATKTWGPMPMGLRKDRGLIFHVPMDGTATVYDVDLSGIGDVVEAAMILRRHHAEAALKVTALGTVDLREDAYVKPSTGVTINVATSTMPAPGELAQAVTDAFQKAKAEGYTIPIPDPEADDEPEPAGPGLPGLTAADGSPLQPIGKTLDPPKRGCGKCGRIGHKANSPKCLGDQDPALRKPSGGQIPDATKSQVADTSHMPHATNFVAGVCDCTPDRAGFTNRGDGVFVHATCGRPSPAVATTVGEAVATGQFPAQLPQPEADGTRDCCFTPESGPHHPKCPQGAVLQAIQNPSPETVQKALDTKLSDPAATVAPTNSTTAPPWPTDWVMEAFAKAQTAREVWNIRTEALNRGAWNPSIHDQPGAARYEQLASEGKI